MERGTNMIWCFQLHEPLKGHDILSCCNKQSFPVFSHRQHLKPSEYYL